MTTLATVAGAVPLAMGVGAGSETRAPLARSIIGGSILSTIVTLIIVPIFYIVFDQMGEWIGRISHRGDDLSKRAESNDVTPASPSEAEPEPNVVEPTAAERIAIEPAS